MILEGIGSDGLMRGTTLAMLDVLADLGKLLDFAGRAAATMPWALTRRPGEVLRQFERVAWGSLGIVVVAGVSVGMVSWLQTRRMLVDRGLEATLPSVLAAAVLIETGPVLASLLVAARMGAGLGAELGTMKLTEELDAREILGASPLRTLVAPRVLACALAVPLLTVILDASALLGGLFAEQTLGNLSVQVFGTRALDLLKLSDIVPATLKTTLFGFLVGLIACWTGLRADYSTEAVGRAATRGVVRSILAVFAADVLLTPWLQAVVSHLGWTS
jgi:phospholipid/cholesterol/gamma-HCH transport system permease protein